uniref:Uncharacterized protein n=1 Tax=Hemiselmis andersenii TaxID=464988 RepID=A0A6U4MAA0_HEMAN
MEALAYLEALRLISGMQSYAAPVVGTWGPQGQDLSQGGVLGGLAASFSSQFVQNGGTRVRVERSDLIGTPLLPPVADVHVHMRDILGIAPMAVAATESTAAESTEHPTERRCSYAGCAKPTKSSYFHRISGESKAGGQDWSVLAGSSLCTACYENYRVRGSLERSICAKQICSRERRCTYDGCDKPTESSHFYRIDQGTKAGGRDWSALAGSVLCHACYGHFKRRGTLERSDRRKSPSSSSPSSASPTEDDAIAGKRKRSGGAVQHVEQSSSGGGVGESITSSRGEQGSGRANKMSKQGAGQQVEGNGAAIVRERVVLLEQGPAVSVVPCGLPAMTSVQV